MARAEANAAAQANQASDDDVDVTVNIDNIDVQGQVQHQGANAENTGGTSENGEQVTICHRTPSGQAITMSLPREAAETHLREHPRDTLGPCPEIADQAAVDIQEPLEKIANVDVTEPAPVMEPADVDVDAPIE